MKLNETNIKFKLDVSVILEEKFQTPSTQQKLCSLVLAANLYQFWAG